MRHGLSADALRLEFQPAVRLGDGTVVGAEALVRWQAPGEQVLDPAAFLPAATANGLMPAVGDWVLRRACREAAAWAGVPYVAVNVSSRELEGASFVASVRGALDESGLDPRRLVLEMSDPAALCREDSAGVVGELDALGVRIAVDAFGTGQGSLLYLRRLPVSMLKIAREFVAGLGVDDDDDAIVASLLNLATAVGVDVVAIGVETAEQRSLLQSLGCEVAQGFLLGRPTAGPPVPAGSAEGYRPRTHHHRPTGPTLDPTVVARIRSLMRDGASLHTMAAALNAEHLAHPLERRWHPRAVAQAIATSPELALPREQWSVL
jgi:EAL domain-containing protein (putative c-di-GMP-specific phosphodiesterase class I)